jgi:hypothetical protein
MDGGGENKRDYEDGFMHKIKDVIIIGIMGKEERKSTNDLSILLRFLRLFTYTKNF